jgi:hypothetical protein
LKQSPPVSNVVLYLRGGRGERGGRGWEGERREEEERGEEGEREEGCWKEGEREEMDAEEGAYLQNLTWACVALTPTNEMMSCVTVSFSLPPTFMPAPSPAAPSRFGRQ